MNLQLSPQEAWTPLPASEWNATTASHLLRRAGWTALPTEVERACRDGLTATLERLFPSKPSSLPKPASVTQLEKETLDYRGQASRSSSEMEQRARRREFQEESRRALQDLSLKWLDRAAQPDHSALEKWTMFLGDIYVVSWQKVKATHLVYHHQELLRRQGLGKAPALTAAVAQSPAMVRYLDLQESKKDSPNENFARELFELFTLGIGNYTEDDIKEAARAFTGYRQLDGEVRFFPRIHDDSFKTVFGQTGPFDGNDIIALIYRQPAAATFVPRELAKYYLTDQGLPEAHLEPFKTWWPRTGYDLRQLALRFFGSRVFYAPEFRGNFIKSPVQFYLSIVQDMGLDVAPLPRKIITAFRQMGQELYQPPNVRGWLSGRTWINSATLAARRQVVEMLFTPLEDTNLNADELVELAAARAEGRDTFSVTDAHLAARLPADDRQLAERFVAAFLPAGTGEAYRDTLTAFLEQEETPSRRLRRVRNAALTLLQSPEYQLC